jgi:hypothetical protein
MTRPPDPAPALRQLRRQLMQMSGEVARLLTELEPGTTVDDTGYAGLPRTEAIVQVLATQGTPMTPVQIWRALHEAGWADEKNLIQVTTYELWRRGRLVKVGRGTYCHPDHIPAGASLQSPGGRSSGPRRRRT